MFRDAAPIDFGIGYRWRPHESNLLLAVKLPDDGTGSGRRGGNGCAAAKTGASEVPRPPFIQPQRGGFFWFGR